MGDIAKNTVSLWDDSWAAYFDAINSSIANMFTPLKVASDDLARFFRAIDKVAADHTNSFKAVNAALDSVVPIGHYLSLCGPKFRVGVPYLPKRPAAASLLQSEATPQPTAVAITEREPKPRAILAPQPVIDISASAVAGIGMDSSPGAQALLEIQRKLELDTEDDLKAALELRREFEKCTSVKQFYLSIFAGKRYRGKALADVTCRTNYYRWSWKTAPKWVDAVIRSRLRRPY